MFATFLNSVNLIFLMIKKEIAIRHRHQQAQLTILHFYITIT